MKLPPSKICALIAVGCRQNEDGQVHNIACTLASTDPAWSSERTFVNLIEATKRIGDLLFNFNDCKLEFEIMRNILQTID